MHRRHLFASGHGDGVLAYSNVVVSDWPVPGRGSAGDVRGYWAFRQASATIRP